MNRCHRLSICIVLHSDILCSSDPPHTIVIRLHPQEHRRSDLPVVAQEPWHRGLTSCSAYCQGLPAPGRIQGRNLPPTFSPMLTRMSITNLYLNSSVCVSATRSAVGAPTPGPWRVCPIGSGRLSTLGTTASTFTGSSGSFCLPMKQGCWCSGSG